MITQDANTPKRAVDRVERLVRELHQLIDTVNIGPYRKYDELVQRITSNCV